MAEFSFFWHDYETWGTLARRDGPAQFAGVRTNAQLEEIEPAVVRFCQPPLDRLPDPESCLITGITPQRCRAEGLPEHDFAALVQDCLGRAGTVGVGYNTLRFDDEVTRFLFWRNLMDPYAREWRDGCGRWDLMDVVRCAYALRPQGIEWPTDENGRVRFKLEMLSAANGLPHAAAHDALSDVRATLALARRVRAQQTRLWDYCLKLRHKAEVKAELVLGRPVLHVSGQYPVERGCLAVVYPFAPHPHNANEVIVWDLAQDPCELMTLDTDTIRQRLFTRTQDLPEGVSRLPIKTIHLNKSPVVVSRLQTLSPDRAERWGIDLDRALQNAQQAARIAGELLGVWDAVYARPAAAGPAPDVDEDLYSGFLGDADRALLQRLRALAPEALARQRPAFRDPRLEELLFRYRARNFPHTLSESESARWQQHRRSRLLGAPGEGGGGLAEWLNRIDDLAQAAAQREDERALHVLGELADWATEVAP